MPRAQLENFTLEARRRVSEPAASTFAVESIPTSIGSTAKQIWELLQIKWSWDEQIFEGESAATSWSVHAQLVAGDQPAALLDEDSPAIIDNWSFVHLQSTTVAGEATAEPPMQRIWTPPPGLFIFDENLWVGIEGLSTTISLAVTCRVFYRLVDIDPKDLLLLRRFG